MNLSRLPSGLVGRILADRAARVAPRRYSLHVHDVSKGEHPVVTLPRTEATVLPGRYGLLTRGSLTRVGHVLTVDDTTVTRELLEPSPVWLLRLPVSWSGALHRGPAEITASHRIVELRSGDVRAPGHVLLPDTPSASWSIHLPGLGATHLSALRSAELAHRSGMASILIDGPLVRHSFGLRERRLLDAAIRYARTCGAERIVVFGWSYGANAALQHLAQDASIDAAVLISPHLHWRPRLTAAATAAGVSAEALQIGSRRIESRLSRRYGARIDLGDLGWPDGRRLTVPVLLLHSPGDETLPFAETVAFAEEQPGAELVALPRAPHTLEWNAGEASTERAVRRFLDRL